MSLKSIAERAAHGLGAAHMIRAANRDRARVLMYHRFRGSPEEVRAELSAQCEHLRRHYHPLSLSEMAAALRGEGRLPPNSLAITIDDGYRDFALAFPIFRAFGLKVTLYVVSGFVDGELWLWPDQVLHLLENTLLTQVSIPVSGGKTERYKLNDRDSRQAAYAGLSEEIIKMPNAERLKTLNELPKILETPLPARAPDRFAALSWDELRGMAREGLDVGAHTRTHPILSKVEAEAGLEDEIAGSRRRIQEQIGGAVQNFCYPNGKIPDVNPPAVAAVQKAGYKTAVIAESGLAGWGTDLYRIPRLGVDPDYSALYFERFVAGYGA